MEGRRREKKKKKRATATADSKKDRRQASLKLLRFQVGSSPSTCLLQKWNSNSLLFFSEFFSPLSNSLHLRAQAFLQVNGWRAGASCAIRIENHVFTSGHGGIRSSTWVMSPTSTEWSCKYIRSSCSSLLPLVWGCTACSCRQQQIARSTLLELPGQAVLHRRIIMGILGLCGKVASETHSYVLFVRGQAPKAETDIWHLIGCSKITASEDSRLPCGLQKEPVSLTRSYIKRVSDSHAGPAFLGISLYPKFVFCLFFKHHACSVSYFVSIRMPRQSFLASYGRSSPVLCRWNMFRWDVGIEMSFVSYATGIPSICVLWI